MVGRQDIAGRVKGEPFDTAAAVFRLPDAAEFVVNFVVNVVQYAAAVVSDSTVKLRLSEFRGRLKN